ncbi:hypothetical protein [Mesorhizobium sp. ES1-1]|uniref:hypothetical protein n=1 Tax=Mesorhizobium sp. ES1-1 TaxID=2876629 RepID=UPI001CCD4496|nr:hypothetical protein [Mesorhizobium sp. ES1-1]MBZ9674338.1 hypothetical protein [Mesorhizobium sp. ES1-1]
MPPAAWAVGTQLAQIFPDIDCHQRTPWMAASCGALLVIAIAGVAQSRRAPGSADKAERFIINVGFLIALTFVFALALQGAAVALLDPCQR